MKKKLTLWLIFVLSLVLSMSVALTGCLEDEEPGDSSQEASGSQEEAAPTIEVASGAAEAVLVKEFTLPAATASEGATVAITGTDPDGEAVAVDENGVVRPLKPGKYTFVYKAVKGDKESGPVTYEITFTAPEKPEIVLTGGTETTIKMTYKYKLAPVVVMKGDADTKVLVNGVDPEGEAVVITEEENNRYFCASKIGDYNFTCTAEDYFGTQADAVTFIIHVLDYELKIDVAESAELGANVDMALPEATVVSSVTPDAALKVTVAEVPEGSELQGAVIENLTFTPDVIGVYKFKYEVTDELEHHAEVMVTVTVTLAPAVMTHDELPATLDEGEEWTVPTFESINGKVAYDWKGWDNDDFTITAEAVFNEAGDHEPVALNPGEAYDLVAGEIHLKYSAVANDDPEVKAEDETVIKVVCHDFEGISYDGADAVYYRDASICDKTFVRIDVFQDWGGMVFSGTQTMSGLMASDEGYLRFVLHNPMDKVQQWNLFMRGPRANIEDYETVFMTGPHPGSQGYETDFLTDFEPGEYREIILPRAYVNDICSKLEFTANKPYNSVQMDLIAFDFVNEPQYKAAYDFSKGLPVVTDQNDAPVEGIEVEKIDDGTIRLANSSEGIYRIDLSGSNLDTGVVDRLFKVSKRQIEDPILFFDITNGGAETVKYSIKMLAENGTECSMESYYAQQFTQDLVDGDPWSIVMEDSPMLTAGKTRRVAIAANLLKRDAGDFRLVVEMQKGELTLSNFRFLDCGTELAIPDSLEALKALKLEEGESANVAARALGCEKVIGYASSDDEVATVDAEGKVTAVKAGECDITISAEGIDSISCHVTVVSLPKPFEGDGITALDLNDLSVDHEGVSLEKLPNGRLHYNTPSYGWVEAKIFIGGDRRIGAEEYLVIKFRYFDDMYFDSDTYSCEGLWPMGYDTAGNTAYFAIFGEDGHDYTIYHRDNDTPYGSYHGSKELTTEPQTWYFAIAPKMGDWAAMSSCYYGAHLEIEGFYAVTSAKKEELFKKGNYPKKVMCAPAEVNISKGETKDLNIPAESLSITADELTYSSDNEAVATVENGVVTAVEVGTCKITVALKDGSASREIAVTVDSGISEISLDRLSVVGSGPYGEMTDTEDGYKYYNSFGNKYGNSMIGISNIPSDKYIVLKFQYIAQDEANDFYNSQGNGQALPEYKKAAGEKDYDYAFIFDANTMENLTNYDANGAPWDRPQAMTDGHWYYWVSPNKGAYAGFTSDYPLKCNISNVYAYSAAARLATFEIEVKE